MHKGSARSVKKILSNNQLQDLLVELNGKEIAMLGPAGPGRELSFLSHPAGNHQANALNAANQLPVLLGSGLGHALEALLEYLESESGPDFKLAVVDKEEDILAASGLKEKYSSYKNILWLGQVDPAEVIKSLSKWQEENGGKPFHEIANPFYLRLDREYYSAIRASLQASAKINFWGSAAYPKFKREPRVLLLTSSYFLIGDLRAAAIRMGLEHELLQVPEGELAAASFVEQLLEAVIRFKPDFALTINHLGVDNEGILQKLLARLKLPLASWFVDNPHLILYQYTDVVSPWTTVFTWDYDNLASLRAMGFEHVEYLPLATDHVRFRPPSASEKAGYACSNWQSRVSFVGNSILHKVEKRLEAANPPPELRARFREIALAFAESDERAVAKFMAQSYPSLLEDFESLETVERKLSFETLITWEATLRYRLDCVKAILPFKPLIVGDDGWLELLRGYEGSWRRHKELNYYDELPRFYPFSELNFNCTSKQMKGAVNQRIFDVPATGAFVLTDWREQIENLFEPGKEVICYHSPGEATELAARYLEDPAARSRVAEAARRRILAEHLYEHRLEAIIRAMRKIYA